MVERDAFFLVLCLLMLLRELHLELAALDVDDIFVRFESSLPVIQDSVRISVLGVQRDD